MIDHDRLLDEFFKLRVQFVSDDAGFYQAANERLKLSEEDVDWIEAAVGSAQFRATFGKLVGSHTTDFENDPWFLAAQRRFASR